MAKMNGRAMAPDVPEGAYALFGPQTGADRNGRKLLVYHNAIRGRDALTGGPFSFRVYTGEQAIAGSEGWRHTKVTLRALNPEAESIVFTAMEESDVWVLGEWQGNVGGAMVGGV